MIKRGLFNKVDGAQFVISIVKENRMNIIATTFWKFKHVSKMFFNSVRTDSYSYSFEI